jgi:hypothetical protein
MHYEETKIICCLVINRTNSSLSFALFLNLRFSGCLSVMTSLSTKEFLSNIVNLTHTDCVSFSNLKRHINVI